MFRSTWAVLGRTRGTSLPLTRSIVSVAERLARAFHPVPSAPALNSNTIAPVTKRSRATRSKPSELVPHGGGSGKPVPSNASVSKAQNTWRRNASADNTSPARWPGAVTVRVFAWLSSP
jgi:hypothetical protein